MTTDTDRRDVAAWRGLPAEALEGFSRLDHDAIARGDRFSREREECIRSRGRCVELRAQHGLGIFEKLRRD